MKIGYKIVKLTDNFKYVSAQLAVSDERSTTYHKNPNHYNLPKIQGTPLFVYERPYGYIMPRRDRYELWEVEYFYYPPAFTSYNCIPTEIVARLLTYAYQNNLSPETYFQSLWRYAINCRWEEDLPEEDNIILASAVRYIREVK